MIKSMKNLSSTIFLLAALLFGLQSCSERENYTDGPTVIDIVEKVILNGKSAQVDHLSGEIQISLPGNTDLSNVSFEAIVPNGVTLMPSNGTVLDLTNPVEVVASNGVTERTYRIRVKLLPSKIAFLGDGATIEDITDDDVKEAGMWALATYGDNFVYIPYDELSDEKLNGVNVILYLHDQVGSSSQPQALKDKLNVLSKFFVQGGKIVAGQLGTGLVEELGRDTSGLKTIIGTGAGGVNPDVWSVGFTSSEASNVLTNGVVRNGNGNIDVIDGGYKEDHNCMWSLDPLDIPKYSSFSSKYNAEVLATWDWHLGSQGSAGIILWNPNGRFKGSIITIGLGGMEWKMNDGRTNIYASNTRTIYKNAIDYLGTK